MPDQGSIISPALPKLTEVTVRNIVKSKHQMKLEQQERIEKLLVCIIIIKKKI
jgi:hypothetical protein